MMRCGGIDDCRECNGRRVIVPPILAATSCAIVSLSSPVVVILPFEAPGYFMVCSAEGADCGKIRGWRW